jgi:hypothetical protein
VLDHLLIESGNAEEPYLLSGDLSVRSKALTTKGLQVWGTTRCGRQMDVGPTTATFPHPMPTRASHTA